MTQWQMPEAAIKTLMMRPISFLLLAAVVSSAGAQTSPAKPLWGPAFGLHFGTPGLFSIAMGVKRDLPREIIGSPSRFLFALAEPGVRAGRMSLGYADGNGPMGRGITLRATALRDWHNEGRNYIGGETSVLFGLGGPRIGVFRSIGAGPGRTRITVDISLLL